MSKQTPLSVSPRTIFGRKVKTLRKAGIIPANLFGKKIKSQSIQVEAKAFNDVYDQVGETGVIDLTIDSDNKKHPALISDLHIDPVSDQILHVDFRQVDLTQKITANVPVEIIGKSEAVETHGAILVVNLDELEVEALPSDFPDYIEIDITSLKEPNDTISVSDIKVDSKLAIQNDPDSVIASAQESTPEEEEPEPTETDEVVEAQTTEQKSESDEAESKDQDKESDSKE